MRRSSAPAVPRSDHYDVNKIKALEPFLGKWVPVPFCASGPGAARYGEEMLDPGPTNWARALVTPR